MFFNGLYGISLNYLILSNLIFFYVPSLIFFYVENPFGIDFNKMHNDSKRIPNDS